MKKFMGLLLVMALVMSFASAALAEEDRCCNPFKAWGFMGVEWETETVAGLEFTAPANKLVANACEPAVADFDWRYRVTGCGTYNLYGKLMRLCGTAGPCECGPFDPEKVHFSLAMGDGWKEMPSALSSCPVLLRNLPVSCWVDKTGHIKLEVDPDACAASGRACFLFTIFETCATRTSGPTAGEFEANYTEQ